MSEPLWTSVQIADATGGHADGPAFAVRGVSIDSRAAEPADLFVALAGARDGHDFIDAALARGAAGLLTARPGPGPRVVVEDTIKGLEALAVAARDRCAARRVAVTGSVGKTSVTQALKAAMALAGRAHGSVKSYNNHIGVPLTLARMPRDTERAVFEIGMNHAGEIEPLSRLVRPDVVAVTNVGPVHIENFDEGERGVARAKAEVFAGLRPGGVAVINADTPWTELLVDAARQAGAQVRTYGRRPGLDAQLLDFQSVGARATVVVRVDGVDQRFDIAQTGAHWGLNSLCVLLVMQALGEREAALDALRDFAPLDGRGAERTVRTDAGAFLLIDDSYNANPVSMAASVSALGARKVAGRRLAVLTDMLELGAQAQAMHASLAGPVADAGVDLVFVAGPLMKCLWDALPPTRRGGYAPDAAALTPLVAQAIEPGDVVMVKGSNGSKAHAIVVALAAMDVGAGGRG